MTDQGPSPQPVESAPEAIDQLILAEYPYPIAANYRRMLEARDWERRTRECIRVFEYSMRAITLGILSQYLIQDRDAFSDPDLNRELYKHKFTNISLGTWVNYLFLALKAYGGKRELFFMGEQYDLYWDTSRTPHQPRTGIRPPFDRLVQIRNTLEHKTTPRDEKSWEKLGREALENLRKVMGHFRFLQNYDLIRIVNAETFEYERYTGEGITLQKESLKSKDKLHPGWFYLSRQDHTILGLHPLLIFWTNREGENWIEGKEADEQDVAVFDQLMKDAVGYIATVVREVIEERDAALLSQLRGLIYYNLEHVKMARQRVQLSWEAVREAALQVSAEEMKGARKKYSPALYLQREAVFRKFQDFLASNKTCFVLTGKSGVGKSNYVLSLADTFLEQPQTAVLMYNAARLDVSALSVGQKISQDLGKLIQHHGEALADVFAELDKNVDMTDRQLLVVFDAINENTNPREVLQKIDQLVGGEDYPWLQVLITSRPEGWRAMKRGLPLADERYYKEKGSEDSAIELEEFTIKLDIFERDELQAVYEKYCNVFHLQTKYSTLKPAVRNALRDPLLLRLVADIYKNSFIPDHIQVNDIYKLYVDNLINTGRLQREDTILLEQELMPLMLKPGFYENKLTAAEIQPARTRDGRPLWELIHNSDMIGGGQKVNDSYIRLRDTELLDESGMGLDYGVSFKYERFYEFFGGRRLYQAVREPARPLDFYAQVAVQLNSKVFLWGALVQALVLELKDGKLSIVKDLAEKTTDNRLLRSALVEALVRFGDGNRSRAESFIRELIGDLTPPPRNFFVELTRLLRPVRGEEQAQPQKMIVVEAAMRLHLTDLLEKLAVEPSPWLRNLAAQNIFYLWKQDHESGLRVLDSLSQRVRGKYLPDLGAAESILALLGAILGAERNDPATLERLSSIGRRSLRRLLYLEDLDKTPSAFIRLRRGFLRIIYNLVTGVVLKFALRVIGDFGEHTWASRAAMEHFFQLSPEQKQLVKSMIPYLDYEEPGFEKRLNDMIKIQDWGDQIAETVVEFSILGHGVKDFEGTLEIVKQLIDYGLSFKPPRFWIDGPLWNLWQSAAHLENPNPAFMQLMTKVTAAIQEDPALWVERARQERSVELSTDTRAFNTGSHMGAYYVFNKRAEIPETIQPYIEQALRANDDEYIEAYIQGFIGIFELGYHHPAIAGIKPLADYKNENVQKTLIDFLVRARNYDPEYMEDLLLRGEFPQEIADRVLANPTSERLTDLLTYQLLNIIYDLFILGPKTLRNELKWLLSKGLELRNFQEFVVLIIREIFNIVLGEVVFSVPPDAPSRQLAKGVKTS